MKALVWIQREFRIDYLESLQNALCEADEVIVAYFHDKAQTIGDANTVWLTMALEQLKADYQKLGADIWILSGSFETIFETLLRQENIQKVYYCFQVGEPFTSQRNLALSVCQRNKVKLKPSFSEFWFAPDQIHNLQGKPYLVFTPFYKTLMKQIHRLEPLDTTQQNNLSKLLLPPKIHATLPADLKQISQTAWAKKLLTHWQIGETPAWQIFNDFLLHKISEYNELRDYPAHDATSRLSPYLHFGHLPARQLYFETQSFLLELPNKREVSQAWLRQLIWKEFARHLLFWFPHTQTQPFQSKYIQMPWNNEADEESVIAIKAWQQGLTGIPIIDAGMRELWETGTMHNRVRMLVASFLTKNLNLHWLIGQKWFDETLLDADPANNAMGWQWVAGCGVDAAPYYRLFNPVRQSIKFDADGTYLRHWLPEVAPLSNKAIHQPWEYKDECLEKHIILGKTYPSPIINLPASQQEHKNRVGSLKAIK
ncbi:cryptochrome/photolyase family protein [Hydrogenovibrio kuenenii]|uniref:cryptochrome/photolyase family protein n=1 Tax=Hydrogenovibrio kuenenii TaxID=63658 RepID=UPI0004634934|nr:deoxyribodipyrimidine photo-lyase [Hydrogenovibrio kuenenii]